MKRLITVCIAALLCAAASAQPQIINVQDRTRIPLDGEWDILVDQYNNGFLNYRQAPMNVESTFFADRHFYQDETKLVEYDFDVAEKIRVPGDWNTQDPRFYYFEGTIWYRRVFQADPKPGKRYFVYFGAVNYEAVTGLNQKILGTHVGGFTPFDYEVTDVLKKGDNSLIVDVNNTRHAEGVPMLNTDWWNYGGITRSVCLIEVPMTFIRDYYVRLSPDASGVEGWVQLDGAKGGEEITVSIPELKLEIKAVAGPDGKAAFSRKFAKKCNPVLWCPENPRLYDVTIASGEDSTTDRIGFRTIETRGSKILVNGKETFLKGVAIHEEEPFAPSGRANSEEHARTTLGWAKEMGCNFVRLAHYPHNEAMIRVAEEMGIMVWDEIPVYWAIDFGNSETYANAESQLVDMITRDKNRANVIIWSVANETPRLKARLDFLSGLISKAREMDPTRLVSAAMEKDEPSPGELTVKDDLIDLVDLISFNQYVGWYDGDSDKCDRVHWTFPVEKPVIITEFGGGAKAGRHGDVRNRFTEEYQAHLYVKNIEMLSRIPELAGASPWILKDFRSPRRQLNGIQDDFNRKGLISENGEKKQAFYVMQKWYTTGKPLPEAAGPVPNHLQIALQDMETYAFIHYSLNTYTDQEWGYGNEDLSLFNPSKLDARQWARTCKAAGMKGIIFTAKHHCGFCMWPSKYTEYSVKNTPWKNGEGDVVRELADACREEGLRFAVYLSPWDRNHLEYGRPAYVEYFRNQLEELLTQYGDIYEVWFDGANGGSGWYGGADEVRQIDRTTYYEWPETYRRIREWQPGCLIWNDGSDRGDLRWVGTEAGNIGETNWSLLYHDGEVPYPMLHYGVEEGDSWVPGETNTSIRPGWFYHDGENAHVKSLSRLMETYYKSVGRNSTLLLNFPVDRDGLIHREDSLRGVQFHDMIQKVFADDLDRGAKVITSADARTVTLEFDSPVTFNRMVLQENIALGQRVKKFSVEALVKGKWIPLKDVISEEPERSMTTIGRKRILCFADTKTTKVRVNILDTKAEPVLGAVGLYLAPEIDVDDPENGEKKCSHYNIWFNNGGLSYPVESMFMNTDPTRATRGMRFLPAQDTKEGMPLDYELWGHRPDGDWFRMAAGEFSNIVNNPVWQTVPCTPEKVDMVRLDFPRVTSGTRVRYEDVEVLYE